MMRKLYTLANGLIGEDNSDSVMNQEILLPGHLYLMFLKVAILAYFSCVVGSTHFILGKTARMVGWA